MTNQLITLFLLVSVGLIKADDPLILTDLIESGQIEEAQKLAKVDFAQFHGVESYSGFLTVNKDEASNLFFWFFPSEEVAERDPLILWLNGGPGSSSLFGLLMENGPFEVDFNGNISRRLGTSWTQSHSVLYIDQPVGTGFSYTRKGYATDLTQVTDQLYAALIQFFKLFPKFQSNDFFIIGEDYAGKYIPSISYKILKSNPTSALKINLKGLAIGNGWIAPEEQLRYSESLYSAGLIDLSTRKKYEELEEKIFDAIKTEDWETANGLINKQLFGVVSSTGFGSLFMDSTGYQNVFSLFVTADYTGDFKKLDSFTQRPDVRKAIHVGRVAFQHTDHNILSQLMDSTAVPEYLYDDYPQSVGHLLPELLDNYKVLIYNGQFDILAPYQLIVNFLNKLEFDGAEEYRSAPRKIWQIVDETVGYRKTGGNLTEVLVRNSAHFVPQDQPEWTYDLINRFVRNLFDD